MERMELLVIPNGFLERKGIRLKKQSKEGIAVLKRQGNVCYIVIQQQVYRNAVTAVKHRNETQIWILIWSYSSFSGSS